MVSNVKELSTTKLTSPLNIDDLSKVRLDGDGVLDKFLQLHRLILDKSSISNGLFSLVVLNSFTLETIKFLLIN